MTLAEQAAIHCHVHDVWEDNQRLMGYLGRSVYEPRNPFSFRTEHEFYIEWRTEWRRLVAKAMANHGPNEAELRDLGLKN